MPVLVSCYKIIPILVIYCPLESEPISGAMFLLTSMGGLAQIGMIITSLALVSANSSPEIRGSIAGYYSVIGGFGILFITQLGGHIFDLWMESGPFVILGILHGVMLLATIFVKVSYRFRRDEE